MNIVDSKKDLQEIWNKLVAPNTLYDEYALRLAFFDPETSGLLGVVDSFQKPTALLPLEQNKNTRQIQFIGAPFLERNRGFYVPNNESQLVKLYDAVTKTYPHKLDNISASDPITKTDLVSEDEAAYLYDFPTRNVLTLSDLSNTVSPRLAERLKVAHAYIGTEVASEKASLIEAVEFLKAISFERFSNDSWLEKPAINHAVRALNTLKTVHPATVTPRLLVTHTGEGVGGHIGVVHKNTYYTLFSAARYVETLPEIGTLVHLTGFRMALEYNCTHLDVGLGECGWKARWGFDPVSQYKYIN